MATLDEHDDAYDELRAELVRSSAALIRQRTALAKAEDENKRLIKRALKAGYSAGVAGFRSDIQKIAPFSVPTVRDLAAEAGVPPDERYVKAAKVRQARASTAPAPAPAIEQGDGRADIDALSPQTVQRLAAQAEEAAPTGWAQRVTAGASAKRHPHLIVIAALAEGYLNESQIPH